MKKDSSSCIIQKTCYNKKEDKYLQVPHRVWYCDAVAMLISEMRMTDWCNMKANELESWTFVPITKKPNYTSMMTYNNLKLEYDNKFGRDMASHRIVSQFKNKLKESGYEIQTQYT